MKRIEASAKAHSMSPEQFCRTAIDAVLSKTNNDNKNDPQAWSNRT